MHKNLTDQEIKALSLIIKENIFLPRSQNKTSIFLCGADIKNESTGRHKLAKLFSSNPRYEILYPEDLFDDLLAGQGQYSLLMLENMLAESVDSIIIFPESPGSFAELGAFSNNELLAKKLICLSNKKFQRNKSFINYGPYRLIKSSSTGKIFHINYEDLDNHLENKKILRNVTDHISIIKSKNPVDKNIANILECENFILPSIYLIDQVTLVQLISLMMGATNHDKRICEVATRSAIGRLINKHLITRTSSGYQVTQMGAIHVRKTFDGQHLDRTRIEVINSQNRRNSRIDTVRFLSSAHP